MEINDSNQSTFLLRKYFRLCPSFTKDFGMIKKIQKKHDLSQA
jgi:hypothetical protein